MNDEEFTPFPKMARLQRTVIITEKIDGTNAQVYITDDGKMRFGSRTRWIIPAETRAHSAGGITSGTGSKA